MQMSENKSGYPIRVMMFKPELLYLKKYSDQNLIYKYPHFSK